MSIYNDVMAAQQLLDDCFDRETGEVYEDQEAEIKKIKDQILTLGMETLCKIRANYIAEAESIRNEELRLAARRKSFETKMATTEKRIKELLDLEGGNKIQAGNFTVSYRMSEAVTLALDFENPEYGKYEYKADKAAIKKALKNGASIEGADIEARLNLQIK